MDMQAMVRAWHEKFGVGIGESPAIRRASLRAELIREEASETVAAIERGDLVEAIDGMCDVLYVVFGTAIEFGVDLAPFFAEVHRTNMLKIGGATREDGKILKPDGWEPPRIAELLNSKQLYFGPHDWTHPAEYCDESECDHVTRRTCEGAEKLTRWLRDTLRERTRLLCEADPKWSERAAANLLRAVFGFSDGVPDESEPFGAVR